MNKIPSYILAGRTETEALNELQTHGVISDNCVTWADVFNKEEATAWLRGTLL